MSQRMKRSLAHPGPSQLQAGEWGPGPGGRQQSARPVGRQKPFLFVAKTHFRKLFPEAGIVTLACNLSTQEADTGGS
jgi:hypothetical protein